MQMIKIVDELLPIYGCNGVEDTKSLINKRTIHHNGINELNSHMEKIREHFPVKLLNLNRVNYIIRNNSQAIGLLRSILKCANIGYTIVRTHSEEYMRLVGVNNLLANYIIHKMNEEMVIVGIMLSENFGKDKHYLVKDFYIDDPCKVKDKVLRLVIDEDDELAWTDKYEYDEERGLWRICFFKNVYGQIMKDALPFHRIIYQDIMVYGETENNQDEIKLYMEYYGKHGKTYEEECVYLVYEKELNGMIDKLVSFKSGICNSMNRAPKFRIDNIIKSVLDIPTFRIVIKELEKVHGKIL